MKRFKTYLYSTLLVLVVILPLNFTNFLSASSNQKEFIDKYRVGCKCCDGWDSEATGSGTCSHHGGVQYWIYYDDATGEYSYKYTGRCN